MGIAGGSKRRQVLAVLDESARSVQHLHEPALRKMVHVLRQAQTELERDLRAWLNRENGEALFTTQRYRNALASIRRALDAAHSMGPSIEDALWTSADVAGHLSTANIIRELEAFGRIFEGTVQPVSLDQAAIIAQGDKLLWKRFESSSRKYAGSIGDGLQQELAISRARSETIFEVTNRLQKRVPEIFQSDWWGAERVARTETLNAYNQYHLEGISQAAEDDHELLSRWDGSFDWRRCPACGSLDGQVRDTANGEKFVAEWVSKSRKRGMRQHVLSVSAPPLHPCCRCVITPWRMSWGVVSRATQAPPAAPAVEELPMAARARP